MPQVNILQEKKCKHEGLKVSPLQMIFLEVTARVHPVISVTDSIMSQQFSASAVYF